MASRHEFESPEFDGEPTYTMEIEIYDGRGISYHVKHKEHIPVPKVYELIGAVRTVEYALIQNQSDSNRITGLDKVVGKLRKEIKQLKNSIKHGRKEIQ